MLYKKINKYGVVTGKESKWEVQPVLRGQLLEKT